MTSRTCHPQLGDSEAGPSKPKKRRTTDADWAQYRPKLKRLYIDERKSKKEVIEIVRDQDGLDITEKQLKYWFEKKWKIPKNKTRKSKVTVQPTARAWAGEKYMLPRNTVLFNQSPSSGGRLDFVNSPLHQVYQQDNSAVDTVMSLTQEYNAPSGLDSTIVSSTETNMFAQISDTPALSSYPDFLQPNLPTTSNRQNEASAVHQPLQQVDTATDGSQAANIPLGAFGGSFTFPESSKYPLPSFQSPPIMAAPGQSMEDSFSDVFDYNGITLSPTAALKELFSSIEVQSQDLLNPKESPGRRRRGSLSMSREGASGIFNPSECLDAALASQSGATSSCSQNLTPMDHLGKDLEKIIPTLQLLEQRILTGLDGKERNLFVQSFGRSLLRLQGALMSDWLQAGLDGVMCQAYQKAANRRSKQTLGVTNIADMFERDDQPEYLSEENGTTSVGKVSSQLVIRSCQACSDGGTFRAELVDLLNNKDKEHRRTADIVTVSYTPRPQWHGTGVSITFSRTSDDGFSINIPPTIKTFNIVPWDAEIMRLVLKNDLSGIKKLFKMGKASPTDVTPSGHSLISYAIYAEALELFNLLLLGGADLQHCDSFTNTCDLVTTIWTYSRENARGTRIPDDGYQCFADFTWCMRMTDIALSNGCEIGSNPPFNEALPSPLFGLWLLRSRSTFSDSEILETTEVIKYLINKGFDREERNNVGQTPLLYAAAARSLGSIVGLKALISMEANATTVDNLGRGVLHSVLLIESLTCRLCCENAEYNYSDHSSPLGEEGVLQLPEGAKDDIDEVWQDEFVFDARKMNESEAGDCGEDGTMGLPQQHDFDDDKEKNEDLESLNEGISQYEEDQYEDSELSEDSSYERETLVWQHIGLVPQGYYRSLMPFGDPIAPLYPKLLLLLEAGCDPNLQDTDRQTPSDYVTGTHLWPEWERALTDSGWIYDTRLKQCIRQIEQEDE